MELKGSKISNMSREVIYVDLKGSKISNMPIEKAYERVCIAIIRSWVAIVKYRIIMYFNLYWYCL